MSDKLMRSIIGTKQTRTFTADRAAIDLESRTVELAFSSEAEYERSFGIEVLDHSEGAVVITGDLPLCKEHDTGQQIGLCESVRIDPDRVGRATARFSSRPEAGYELQDIADGIRGKVSVGYWVHGMELAERREDGPDVYRVTRWEPIEVSLVTVPADVTVGVGRSADGKEAELSNEPIDMVEPEEPATVEAEAAAEPEVAPVVVEVKTHEDGVADERRRVREIKDICEMAVRANVPNAAALAERYIADGKDARAYREEVNSMDASPEVSTRTPDLGLTPKETRSYRMMNVIRALANPHDRKAQEDAAFEFECSREMEKLTGKSASGALLPTEVYHRDLSADQISTGGALVETSAAGQSMIEVRRNAMVIRQLGATFLDGLVGDVSIPKQTGGASTYWVHDSDVTESQATFGQVNLTPHTVGAMTDIKRSMLKQSSIGIENMVANDISLGLAHEIDDAAFNGAGTAGEPQGLANITAVATGVIANGAPTLAELATIWATLAADNVPYGYKWCTNAAIAAYMMSTPKVTGGGSSGMIMENDMVLGLPVILTQSVASGHIFLGRWDDLIVASWGTVDLNVDTSTGSASGTVRIVALQDVDIAVRHGESFIDAV